MTSCCQGLRLENLLHDLGSTLELMDGLGLLFYAFFNRETDLQFPSNWAVFLF